MATLSGGTRFDALLRKMTARLNQPGTLSVGFLENATYPDGTPVATVAAIQNFGAPAANIPARPFFSNMIRDNAAGWPSKFLAVLRGADMDVPRALALMGEGIRGQLIESIQNTNAPPLADATIARKGFIKPLIETGHMWNSIDYEVGE